MSAVFSVLVVGASINPERYSFKATQMLLDKGFPVTLLGLKESTLFGFPIYTLETIKERTLSTRVVTIYVSAKNQGVYYDLVESLKPKFVIFNPGTENPSWEQKLTSLGIEPIQACTLVMLGNGLFSKLQEAL